jgi:hypothetical protein
MARNRSKNQHVIPHESKWAVRGEGNDRYTSVHETQAEAIRTARDIAINQNSDLIIHRADGRIRDRDSFRRDPFPPKSPRQVLFPLTRTVTDKQMIRRAIRKVLDNGGRVGQSKSASQVRDKRH